MKKVCYYMLLFGISVQRQYNRLYIWDSIYWFNNNTVTSAAGKAHFILDSKYDTVSGTVFLSYKSKNTDLPGYLELYGDGKLLYTSPTFKAGVLPENFEVDVSGVYKLTVAFHGTGTGGFLGSSPAFGVSNLIAQKSFPD